MNKISSLLQVRERGPQLLHAPHNMELRIRHLTRAPLAEAGRWDPRDGVAGIDASHRDVTA